MAQTNTVSVFVQMSVVTAIGVADRPEDCSKCLLHAATAKFLLPSVVLVPVTARQPDWADRSWIRADYINVIQQSVAELQSKITMQRKTNF